MWRFDLPEGRTVYGAMIKVPRGARPGDARFIQVYNTYKGMWSTTLIHLDSPDNIPALMDVCTPPPDNDNTAVDGYDAMIEQAHAHVNGQTQSPFCFDNCASE